MPTDRHRLRLRTFGGLLLERDRGALRGAALQPRRLVVLAALAAAGERGLTRAKLLGLLWPETDEAHGRQALSQALYALRRDCGTNALVVGREAMRLNSAVITSDVEEFESAVSQGDTSSLAALHVGPFLDGVYLAGAPEVERWVDERRAYYASRAAAAMERLAADAEARADHTSAADWWRRLAALDPFRTQAALGVMRELALGGDRADALRHADQYSRLVREELEAEPNSAVEALATQLRRESREGHHEPGALAGRYVIERELGRGGMAVVYLARDLRHGRPVAVKMLHPEVSATLGRERLEHEIVVTAGLRHPHILPLFDSGATDGTLFFVMPFVEGESLRGRLTRDGILPIAEALRLAREVAEALHHAHQRGIVHLDVKPENILLSEGHAVVMDFGIARTVSGALASSTQHGIIGTPAYMSPEQVAGDADLDARSDVFALGCVLYEMLSGRPPWISASVHDLAARRDAGDPPPLHELRPAVSVVLAAEVQRAFASDPAERHGSALLLADTLDRLAALLSDPFTATSAALPSPPGVLVGRERELVSARALLLHRDIRLLTLTGAGGSGKTRLALQLAAEGREQFGDGVRFVDLSATIDAAIALSSIANALGAPEHEGLEPFESIAAHIGTRHLLLVLDNVEQVVSAASSLARVLAACPRLTILATSRTRLRVRFEQEFFVSPLPVPDGIDSAAEDELRASPSVSLFVQRATEARADFAASGDALRAVAAICVHLDGLPLAIELAAARCRVLSPQAVLARMDRRFELLTGGALDLPSRQQTLRGAIAWSHDLLQPIERDLLRHLAVFAGGASVDAAIAVFGRDEAVLLAGAQGLADASLIRCVDDARGASRFVLLESVREFAREQLEEHGEAEDAGDRHLAWFAGIAARLGDDPREPGHASAHATIDDERDNYRAAMNHAERSGAREPFARLVLSLWRTWLVGGQWTEGRDWIARAIHAAPSSAPLVADLLAAGATLSQNQGDYEAAYTMAARALHLWREANDRAGEARTLASIGWIDWRRCRFEEARHHSEESLALHRELGDTRGVAQALSNLGWIALFEGDDAVASTTLEESLAIRSELGDRRNTAFTMTSLAWALSRHGQMPRARALLGEARATFQDIGERQLLAFNLRVTAALDVATGRAADAVRALEEVSVPVFRLIGDRWGLCVALCVLGDARTAVGCPREAADAYDESLEIAIAIKDPLWIATGLAQRAVAAFARHDIQSAARFVGEVEELLASIGVRLPAEHRDAYAHVAAHVRVIA